jgi:hypothetical protein
MSWLYSRALVEVFSEDTSLDGEPSALSSGNPTPQAYCAPDKMTDFSRLSRYGMTYKPLTETRGEELLTLYREVFHAKTSAQRVRAQGLMENAAGCGEKWHASFARYDPDSCLWKTPQCSLLGGLDEFSETWPAWGLMRGGECWEQRTLEQTIRGTGCGLLENKWPTPKVQDSRHAISRHITDPEGRWKGNLGEVVYAMETFPTPMASDNRDRGNLSSPSVQRRLKIGKQVSLGQSVSQVSGRLNPTWVEWLMGWPLGWTDLKPLETDKSHCVQLPPGGC